MTSAPAGSFLSRLQANWKSGLTVALVSIPLSVSLAVASESTPTAGIITAIWAGLLASVFGGSRFNIVGPTGALSGILAAYALTHGASVLPMLAIVAGVFVLLAWTFKLHHFLVFVPASTMHGFTLAVAIIIALNQFNFATGIGGLARHEKFLENVWESLTHLGLIHWPTVVVFGVFLALLFVFLRLTPKFPGAIILTPAGILLGYLGSIGKLPFELATLGSRFADIQGKLFASPNLAWDNSLVTAGLAVALVAILETMISAKIADNMTKTKHNERRELLGLGLANMASGLAGGLPATAALARTSLNIKSGGTDRISATVSSICIAVISIFLLAYFRFIPLAVIAAILVFVSVRMVELVHFARLYKYDKANLAVAFLVAFVCLWEDPIVGILVGTAVSLVVFMEKLSKGQFELSVNDKRKMIKRYVCEDVEELDPSSETLVYSIKGELVYVNAKSHIERLEGWNRYTNIILRLRELAYVDLDGEDAFEEILVFLREHGKNVLITGVSPSVEKVLEQGKEFQSIKRDGRVFDRTLTALKHLNFPMPDRA